MTIFPFFKRIFIISLLLILPACSGGGGDGAGNAGTPSPSISLSEDDYDFGGIVVGNNADHTFQVANTGNANLDIRQITITPIPPTPPDLFTIMEDTCSNTTVRAGRNCSFKARFFPREGDQGESEATIDIHSNDRRAVVPVFLSGEGYGLNVWINKIDDPVDTVDGCEVTFDVTVTNPFALMTDGPLDLFKDNFTLHEDGELIKDFEILSYSHEDPVSVVLALDWSGSLTKVIGDVQTGAIFFLDQLIDGSEAAVCKFNRDIGFEPESGGFLDVANSDDLELLTEYIDAPFGEPAGTKLYDAVYASIERATHGMPKRAVVVLSDGVDNGSVIPTLDDVIAYATSVGIPVFTIFYVDEEFGGGGYGDTELMQTLAQETGGQHYNGTTDDLGDVYRQISDTLSSRYTITYTSPSSPTCTGTPPLDVRADYDSLYGKDSGIVTFR